MTRAHSVALVAGGSFDLCGCLQAPRVRDQLGPVKATNIRTASRLVNRLRAGRAVAEYADLQEARVVLLCVPDALARQAIEELVRQEAEWRGRSVVIWSLRHSSALLAPLAERGAWTASAYAFDHAGDRTILVEGQASAVRMARQLFRDAKVRILKVTASRKSLYAAGTDCCSRQLLPLLSLAVDCFRQAGVTPPRINTLLEQLVLRTVRAYSRAGKNALSSSRPCPELVQLQLHALTETDPALARLYSLYLSAWSERTPATPADDTTPL
jgi:predicted short-subunit dehydrogenase-like oxidoreductase (DUF2520 family)